MEAELDNFKLHDNLLNFRVEKFKASIARLLPSRRKPTRTKHVKMREEDNDENYNPNDTESPCPTETSTKKFENENSPADFAFFPSPRQKVTTTAAVTASSHESPSAVTSPQIDESLSRKCISDENLASVDDKNADSETNNCNSKNKSKNRWSFQYTRSKFKKPFEAGSNFPEAKSELESVLQRALRSKGESWSKAQQNRTTKENTGIPSATIEPTAFPKRISFVTVESLKETKRRLRHLGDFSFGLPTETSNNSSIGGSGELEHDHGICKEVRSQSDDDDGVLAVTSDSTSNCSLINSVISCSAGDTITYVSDDHCELPDFEPISDLSSKNTIFSEVQLAPETSPPSSSGLCESAELELPVTSVIRESTAEVTSPPDESRFKETEIPPLLPKGGDISQLLRKFEKLVADEAVTIAKPIKTPKNDNFMTPAKVFNDSWTRKTEMSSNTLRLDTSTSSTASFASSSSWNATPLSRAWDSVETPLVTRGRIFEALESLRKSSSSVKDFEPHSQLLRRSNDSQEMENLAQKRHSIAGDNAKPIVSPFTNTYGISMFGEKPPSPPTSDQLKTAAVDEHEVEGLPLFADETTVPAADTEQLKHVEFSETQIHFAAVKPREMKTVASDESEPSTNLYRYERRSVSASPKRLAIGSSYSDYDEHKKAGDYYDSIFQTNRRSSFGVQNWNDRSHTWPEDNFSSTAESKKMVDLPKASTSLTYDNGSAATLSSMKESQNIIRRSSWSICDENESNTSVGSSSKTNFGKEGVTEIADTKSGKQSLENVSPKSRDEEISEISHSKPSTIEEEDVLKTVTHSLNVDMKRATTTVAAVNVLQDLRPEDTVAAAKAFAAVLLNLNDAKEAESTPAPLITGAHDSNPPPHHRDNPRSRPRPDDEHVIAHRLADDRYCGRIYTEHRDRHPHRTPDTFASKASSSRAKTDCRPVTIVHHGVRLHDKGPADGRRLAHRPASSTTTSELVDSKSRSRNTKPSSVKEPRYMIGIGGGSLRKKTSTIKASSAGRERLFDSGRDGWLNLPKEYKSTASSGAAERKEPAKSLHIAQPLRTGDISGGETDSKHTPRSQHSSRLPTPRSSRKSRKVELVDRVDTVKTRVAVSSPDARRGIASATYRDMRDNDLTSHRTTHRKPSSKPTTTVSKKSGIRLFDGRDSYRGTPYAKIRSTAVADVATKQSVARNPSNSSLGSRSNSYEFKQPTLKTEERSKQRAARILQRAASTEASTRRGHVSSSEDMALDSGKCGSAVTSKPKLSRHKSTKMSKPEAVGSSTRIRTSPRSKPDRNTKDGSVSSRVTRPTR